MTLRCGCWDQGDDIVFGAAHTCSKPRLQDELDRLEREDPAVARSSASLDAVYEHLKGRLPSPLVAEIYDLERPFERVLSDDCEPGDLG